MANSYLTRTPSSAGSRVKWTYSVWLKRSKLGAQQPIWAATTDGNNYDEFYFNTSDKIQFSTVTGGSQKAIRTTRAFRDPSAWYHIVLVYDTGNSTDTDHAQLWINGVRETSFEDTTLLASGANNVQSNWNNNIEMKIGRVTTNTAAYFEGYMSHAAFVNDAVVAPTTFGETDSTSGIWKFKSPSGVTWGTNGFHLKFENSGNLGLDSSGQSNNFATNGNLKQALDTPSNVYCNVNPLDNYSYVNSTLTNGNTTVATGSGSPSWNYITSTLGFSTGKWYWEVKLGTGNSNIFGFAAKVSTASGDQLGASTAQWGYQKGGNFESAGSSLATLSSVTTNDIVGFAIDATNNKAYIHKNGTYMNSGNPSTGANGITIAGPDAGGGFGFYFPAFGDGDTTSDTYHCNFGNGFFGTTAITSAGSNGNGSLFEYDVPSGFYAINTRNLNTYG